MVRVNVLVLGRDILDNFYFIFVFLFDSLMPVGSLTSVSVFAM
jgi:hypothetical protein